MSSIDPIWLATVLGAQAHLRPTGSVALHLGDRDPGKAYFRLKQAIRDRASIGVDIMDIGPGSAERRQLLAEALQQHPVGTDPLVRRRAGILLESVLSHAPQTIVAAGFDEDDAREALRELSAQPVT